MSFLQLILEDHKKCLTADQVRPCNRVRNWLPEYAPKNVWYQVRDDPTLIAYLPDEEMDLGRWPDRRFFWGVLSTLRSDWVEKYASEAATQRDKIGLGDPGPSKKAIQPSDGWRKKLLEHNFASRSKGKCALLLTLL